MPAWIRLGNQGGATDRSQASRDAECMIGKSSPPPAKTDPRAKTVGKRLFLDSSRLIAPSSRNLPNVERERVGSVSQSLGAWIEDFETKPENRQNNRPPRFLDRSSLLSA